MLTRERAEQRLAAHGQQHVLRWFDELSPAQQQNLLAQVEQLDLPWLEQTLAAPIGATAADAIEPYRDVIGVEDQSESEARALGEAALGAGRLGVLLVAGGQGTRLGFDGPKGALTLAPISGRTLFQIHVDRLLALGRRYGAIPPLYLMTSPANHDETCALFERNDRYGMPADRLRIFSQGVMPAVDEHGKLLLAARDSLVMSPNGNGGLFAALRDSGSLDHMAACGVDTISYIQVDNPLSPSAEPRFVGHHLLRRSEFSCKAMAKSGASEKVGNFARVRGRLSIVEYTEIPQRLASSVDEHGALLFGWASPGLFLWSRSFVARQAIRRDLPYHLSHKKIPHLDATGRLVQPLEPNGYKLESFALDTLPDASPAVVVTCERDAEFAPVKNAAGVDSPDSARALMVALYRRWIERAGGRVDPGVIVEIHPSYALDAAELAERLPPGFHATAELYLTR